jgi:hypothetical protein
MPPFTTHLLKGKSMDFLILVIGSVGIISVLLAVGALLNGWALTLLWSWFVVPTFPDLPVLSLGQAIGLGMIISFLTYQYIDARAKQGR